MLYHHNHCPTLRHRIGLRYLTTRKMWHYDNEIDQVFAKRNIQQAGKMTRQPTAFGLQSKLKIIRYYNSCMANNIL